MDKLSSPSSTKAVPTRRAKTLFMPLISKVAMVATVEFDIRLKRAYEPHSASDGTRILIDRLWPRGVTKKAAAIDHWFRDLAPSTELRQWFGHDVDRWKEFRRRYTSELKHKGAEIDELRRLVRQGPVTLVFAARDEEHNDAVVLRRFLLGDDAAPRSGRHTAA